MSLKKSFSKDKTKCTVTFTVEPEAAQGAKTVNIAGDFNSWSSTDYRVWYTLLAGRADRIEQRL